MTKEIRDICEEVKRDGVIPELAFIVFIFIVMIKNEYFGTCSIVI